MTPPAEEIGCRAILSGNAALVKEPSQRLGLFHVEDALAVAALHEILFLPRLLQLVHGKTYPASLAPSLFDQGHSRFAIPGAESFIQIKLMTTQALNENPSPILILDKSLLKIALLRHQVTVSDLSITLQSLDFPTL